MVTTDVRAVLRRGVGSSLKNWIGLIPINKTKLSGFIPQERRQAYMKAKDRRGE